MLDLLTRAKNAIEVYNSQLRVNSANIANMSNPGYKSIKISFQTLFERLINAGSTAEDGIGGTNPIQMGASVGVSSTWLDFTQGGFTDGGPLDVAIQGSGLFIISPNEGQTLLYTRAGRFRVDGSGNLVTDTGMQVYGYSSGGFAPIQGLTEYNPLLLSFSTDGRLVEYADDTFTTESRDTGFSLALTSFTNLSGLAQAQGNAFAETAASGTPLEYASVGGTYGTISPRRIEQSNVFYSGEIIDSMEAQRAMTGNLTIVRMINDEITNFINRIS